jgi:hypothetical protein
MHATRDRKWRDLGYVVWWGREIQIKGLCVNLLRKKLNFQQFVFSYISQNCRLEKVSKLVTS